MSPISVAGSWVAMGPGSHQALQKQWFSFVAEPNDSKTNGFRCLLRPTQQKPMVFFGCLGLHNKNQWISVVAMALGCYGLGLLWPWVAMALGWPCEVPCLDTTCCVTFIMKRINILIAVSLALVQYVFFVFVCVFSKHE